MLRCAMISRAGVTKKVLGTSNTTVKILRLKFMSRNVIPEVLEITCGSDLQ